MINFIKRLFGFKSVVSVPATTDIPEFPQHPSANGSSGLPAINLGYVHGATKEEYNMIITALVNVRDIVYSKEFADEVLSSKFTSTNFLSNQQILELFTKTLITVNIDFYTGSFYQNHITKTVGYENGDGYIHMNRFFIKDHHDTGSNMLHEIAHSLGFKHGSKKELTSVPYSMNRIYSVVANKLNIN